jgi:hypothetical protein
VIRRRGFRDVVRRQLDVFEHEQGALIRSVAEAERAYDDADRDDAEELYGDYADLVEECTEALASLRDHYASTIEGEVAARYEEEFNRAVLKRYPRFALELED